MSILSFLSHPVTLAAAAVIAIGVVIYEIVNSQEDRMQHGKRSAPDRRIKSCSSEIVSYEDTANSVRQRKRNETTVKSSSPTNTKSQDKRKLSEEPDRKFDEKGYYQNVFDKIGNDVKNLNKDNDDKKTFNKSIDDRPASSSSVEKEEVKVINIPTSNANQPHARDVLGSRENVCNQETDPINRNDPCCSAEKTVVNDKQNNTETDTSLCMACEEVVANAVAHPCEHCYLCINCATIVHRIYTKCNECDNEIEYFHTIEM